ncbi:MAG TPA: MBL fold metallo-hydrolase [Stellaceae bacterium]|jgi:L-ascorbate metabolism protein UlaG (beta-lactamase superfamily)|nr:MBL fold metallo-hydrolase [Stellaceae bacterium]
MPQLRAATPSDHCDGARFFNPGRATQQRGFGDFLRWRLSRKAPVWPRWIADADPPLPPDALRPGAVAVTYIGHATLLLRFAGFAVLTDPMFSLRASPFAFLGPKRVRPPAVALDDLPRIDAVVLSHNHYDHMDLPSLRRLRARDDPPIVTGIGNGAYLAGKGLDHVIELDWWERVEPVPGLGITYVPAQHWSRRRFGDTNRMLWGGHVVEAGGARAYFAGDTGYPAQFAEIARRLGAPDVALLPIGAYEPRWFMSAQHMNPDDAVRAHLDLGARLSIAIHFATFALTDEPFDAPQAALAEARRVHGLDASAFRVPAFGETILAAAPL